MQAHLYDEDRWPSGAAGSLVTRDDRYKYRYCSVNIYTRAADALKEEKGTPLAWFSAKVSGSVKDKNLVVKNPVRPPSGVGTINFFVGSLVNTTTRLSSCNALAKSFSISESH